MIAITEHRQSGGEVFGPGVCVYVGKDARQQTGAAKSIQRQSRDRQRRGLSIGDK